MAKKYYITVPGTKRKIEEVSADEYMRLIGNYPYRGYAHNIYVGKLTIDEVPEEYREITQTVVQAKIDKFGLFPAEEASETDYLNALAELGVELNE